MFKNYCKTALLHFSKHTIFSFINIAGLTIGLTSFILIGLFVFDECTFDRAHRNADNIYRVVESKTSADGKTTKRSGTGFQVSARAVTHFPEIKDAARISQFWRAEIASGDHRANIFHEDLIAANPGFLTVFSFPLLYGDRTTALTAPKSIILTQEMARKVFGVSDVLGKLLFFDNDSVPYKVTGVLKDFPVNSSISYPLLVSESSFSNNKDAEEWMAGDWTSGAFSTYFLLDRNTDVPALSRKLDDLIASNYKAGPGNKSHVQLQPLQDVHFHSGDIEGNSGVKGNIFYVYVFLVLACFIIFIACINYMNLSTARFTTRGKEIAIRKVAGASRATLVKQFLVETLLATFLSVALSIILVNVLLPLFNSFTGKDLSLDFHTDYRIWAAVLLVTVLVTLLAGLYPALFQSGLHPLSLLKSKALPGGSNISLRRSLVVFQFAISIVLIAATMIIYEQMRYVNNKDLGFDKDNLVVIDINSGDIHRSVETVRSEFSKLAQVESVSVTSMVPGDWNTIPTVKVISGNSSPEEGKDMYYFGVDGQFLSTYAIRLLKGRNFFPSGRGDSSSVLVNESAAKALGITDPLGQEITIPSANFGGDNRSAIENPIRANVVGIVSDFNFQSLHEKLAPMVLGFKNSLGLVFGHFTVKLRGGDPGGTLKQMNDILRRIDQSHLFQYHFLDKQWELLYREDKRRQTVFVVFALLAIFIASLGLLGLTLYEAEQRVKEIGIRKVMGASVGGIVIMLSRDFLKWVLIAAIIAIPVAWFFMQKWLDDFAYRITIDWPVFVCSTLLAILMAMTTIGLQVAKAATANPVKSLRAD